MKALTSDEQQLLDYIDNYCPARKVYKYYEADDEERSSIPDIWDKLQDDLNLKKDKYDEARLKYSHMDAQSAVWYHHCVNDAEIQIKLCERLIQKVTDSDAVYFLYDDLDNELIAVRKEDRPVYKLSVENKRLVLVQTEETVNIWTFERQITALYLYDNLRYTVTAKSGNTVTVDSREPVLNRLYAFSQLGISNLNLDNLNKYNKWFTCVACGEIYSLSCGEIFSYTKKGLCLPKRCLNCRIIRRQKKQSWEIDGTGQNDSVSTTSLFGM